MSDIDPDADSRPSTAEPDPALERERQRRERIRTDKPSGPPETPQCTWTDLTGFQRDLLKTIRDIRDADDDLPTGQHIRRVLEPDYSKDINHGRLYQNLGTLREEGFIRKVPVDGRTNAYYLRDDTLDLLHRVARDFATSCDLGVAD